MWEQPAIGAGQWCMDFDVTINGGMIDATASNACGIGENYYGSGSVTINGGTIVSENQSAKSTEPAIATGKNNNNLKFDQSKFKVKVGSSETNAAAGTFTTQRYINASPLFGMMVGATSTFGKKAPAATSVKKLSSAKRGFKVTWKKQACKGYQVRYSKKSSMKSAKVITISKAGTLSKKVTKLKSKKKYYVQVRAYNVVNDKKYYSAWTKKKAVKTK